MVIRLLILVALAGFACFVFAKHAYMEDKPGEGCGCGCGMKEDQVIEALKKKREGK